MTNVASLIQDLGGNAAFGRMVGVSTEHAGSMKRRDSIPVRHWHKLIEGSKEAGRPVSYEDLVRLHTPREALSEAKEGV